MGRIFTQRRRHDQRQCGHQFIYVYGLKRPDIQVVGGLDQLVRMERGQHQRIYQNQRVHADPDPDPDADAACGINKYADTDPNPHPHTDKNAHQDPDTGCRVNTLSMSGGKLCSGCGIRVEYV